MKVTIVRNKNETTKQYAERVERVRKRVVLHRYTSNMSKAVH